MGPQASQDGHKVGPGLAHDIEENALQLGLSESRRDETENP